PWIVIKNEHFPRVFWTRKHIKDGSKYYGPYASVGMMHIVLDMIRELFPLRTCNLNLAPENIAAGKYKVCLEYQIGNCKGPCQAYQSQENYDQNLSDIKDILNGKISVVTNRLKEQMNQAVAEMNFEGAHTYKLKIEKLANYQSKSTIVNSSISNVDVFSIASEDNYAFVNYLKVVNGVIIQTQTVELKKRLDETDVELLSLAIPEIRARFQSLSREIVVPFDLDLEGNEQMRFVVPKLGEKRKLLDLSLKNVAYFK